MFQQNKKKSNKNEHLANKGKLKKFYTKIVPRGKPGCNPEYDMYNKIRKK